MLAYNVGERVGVGCIRPARVGNLKSVGDCVGDFVEQVDDDGHTDRHRQRRAEVITTAFAQGNRRDRRTANRP